MISKDQFGFNAFWWEKLDTKERLRQCTDFLARTGFKYVEFKIDSFNSEQLREQLKLAVETAEASGLKVSNFVILRPLSSGDPRHTADVIDTIRAAAEANVSIINTISGPAAEPRRGAPEDWWMPAQMNHGAAWDHLVRALEQIGKVLDECDSCLALEPIVGSLVHDYYSICEMYARFDHPRLGITLDPSHLLLYRNDIPYAIRRLGGRIKHVHMKDAVGRPGEFGLDFMFPSLGAGAIDWKAFLTALEDIRYTGAISGEYEQFKYMAQVRGNDPAFAAQTLYEEMTALYVRARTC